MTRLRRTLVLVSLCALCAVLPATAALSGPRGETALGWLMLAWSACGIAAAAAAICVSPDQGRATSSEAQSDESASDDLALMAGGLAHEMRHPLNAVRFTLASLCARVEKMAPSEIRDEALAFGKEIKDDLTRLEEIIDSFLRYARPESRTPERLDLRRALDATARFLRADLTNRGMTMRIEKPETRVEVMAPEMHVRHALFNMVLNAADASSEGDEIVARLFKTNGKARFEVEDRGAGVAEENVDRIFDPFFSTREGGTGLGLAICRRLVSDAGGTVGYGPASPRGSVFFMELPLAEGGAE